MNADFEKRLSRQTIKGLPPGWKHGILDAARDAAKRQDRGHAEQAASPGLPGRFLGGLRDLFWPSPYAWGSLASVWILLTLLGAVWPEDQALGPSAHQSRQGLQLVQQRQQWVLRELAFEDASLSRHPGGSKSAGKGPRSQAPATGAKTQNAIYNIQQANRPTIV